MIPIKSKKVKLHQLSTSKPGYYYESLVINQTINPIMVIDHNNKRMVIEPAVGNIDGTIVAIIRVCNGPRQVRMQKHLPKEDMALDSYKVVIDDWHVAKGPVYVEELDMMIASPECGQTLKHINSRNGMNENVMAAIQGIVTRSDNVTLNFVANDPKGRVDKLFGAFSENDVFHINVLHIPDKAENEATITVTVSSDDKTYISRILEIEPLFEKGSHNVVAETIPLSLGLTAEEAIKAVSDKDRESERYIYDQVAKRTAVERDHFKEQITEMKESHKAELTELKNNHIADIAERKKEYSTIKAELEAASKWKEVYLTQIEAEKQKNEVYTYHAKRIEAEERAQKAKLATVSETTKLVHTVAKIAGGVVVGAVVPWLLTRIKDD